MPPVASQIRTISVALIGNPNSGKTTLFNALTGLNQKTGNYPGVTVDKHTGSTKLKTGSEEFKLQIADLPGTYSLFPKSLDEEVACKELLGLNGTEHDVAVVVTDASTLKRHLLLATQVIDLKIPVVIVLNMIDEANKAGLKIDAAEISRLLGVKIALVNSRTGEGLDDLKFKITQAKESVNTFIETTRLQVVKAGAQNFREIVVTQFTGDAEYKLKLQQFEEKDTVYRFNTINYIFARCVKSPQESTRKLSYTADKFITHPVFGYLTLLFVLFSVFQIIFFLAEYPMNWIESFFGWAMEVTAGALPQGQLSDLLVNGVLAGLSGVVIFIPQIALLFFFIGLLEDSGYMARVSFIMDKVFRRFGLNGKSVIPIVSGVACAVPSVLGTRTISNVKERLITIFIIPLMSCSARLPVYTLLISLMIPDDAVLGILNLKGLTLFGLYFLGFAATMLTAFVLKFIIKSKEKSYFVMELPVYRLPQWKSIGIIVVNKVKVFLWEAGKIILAVSIVLWFLSSHGPSDSFDKVEQKYTVQIEAASDEHKGELIKTMEAEKLETSYAGILGKKIEPVIKPMGFDWKIGIALITSFAAREVFVGTMATIYSANDAENVSSIREKLLSEKNPETGKPVYGIAVCLSLLIFYAFAMQCMSTMAVVYRETKSWKWMTGQLIYMTGLAYVSSVIVYHLF